MLVLFWDSEGRGAQRKTHSLLEIEHGQELYLLAFKLLGTTEYSTLPLSAVLRLDRSDMRALTVIPAPDPMRRRILFVGSGPDYALTGLDLLQKTELLACLFGARRT